MRRSEKFTHGSLFSGIGGFDLAAHWMGWENLFHCEIEDYICKKTLQYYWPNAIHHDDITTTDFNIYRGRIDILSGGFPCQPYSAAGKRLGKEDDRHLWPHMLRAIKEIQPRWVVGENVFGIVNWNGGLVFHEVQADLEAAGYEVQSYVLPACAVNAPHRRDRVWFVAHANGKGKSDGTVNEGEGPGELGQTIFGTGWSTSHSVSERVGGGSGEVGNKGRISPEGRGTGLRQEDGKVGASGDNTTSQDGTPSDTNDSGTRERVRTDSHREEEIQGNKREPWVEFGAESKDGDVADSQDNGRGGRGNQQGKDTDTDRERSLRQREGEGRDEVRTEPERHSKGRDVADPTSAGSQEPEQPGRREDQAEKGAGVVDGSERSGKVGDDPHTGEQGLEGVGAERNSDRKGSQSRHEQLDRPVQPAWEEFPTQQPLRSGNDGIPGGLDGTTVSKHNRESIKAYGNAVVPQVVMQIFQTIQKYEDGETV